MSRKVLVVVVGWPPEPIASTLGDYGDWFEALLQGCEVTRTDGTDMSRPLPHAADYDGVVISGSAASMTEPEPWKDRCCELARNCHAGGTPLLGVCFGHQVIGAAFGARVIRNPRGWEASTVDVDVTPAGASDPLFRGVPARFRVNQLHQDVVDGAAVAAAEGIVALAANRRTAVQALGVGSHVRGVQFHPEFDGTAMKAFVEARSEWLTADAESRDAPDDMPAALAAQASDAPDGVRIFANFLEHFVAYA